MAERIKPKTTRAGGGAYYKPPSDLHFINTGCSLLNLVISSRVDGGYVLGRMTNIIGDKSTGKTLLAIEACANFHRDYKKGAVLFDTVVDKNTGDFVVTKRTLKSDGLLWYREAEAAFDQSYAATLGMPIKAIDFGENRLDTVEDFERDLKACCAQAKKAGVPGLYILDSMDALSDEAEMGRDIGEATYGTGKAKANSVLFRKLTREIGSADVCLIIISQIRDKIGFVIGEKTTRSGGKALDFYASQAIKLAHLATLVSTIKGIKRPTGVRVKAKATKNKIALPFRECSFIIRFGYGVEDYEASMEWLIESKRNKDLGVSLDAAKALLDDSGDWGQEEYDVQNAKLRSAVDKAWGEIESDFQPARKKYG